MSTIATRLQRQFPPTAELAAFWRLQRQLARVPRYTPGEVSIRDWDLHYLDSASLLTTFENVIVKRWNDFSSTKHDPVILDCGANIGINAIHYRRLFPGARITAFEPDPRACDVLRRNLRANGSGDVEVVQAAVWKNNGSQSFFSEGADGNRLATSGEAKKLSALTPRAELCTVETVRLTSYLGDGVDFVKLDIEGAEADVVTDCAEHLNKIQNMVVEFHMSNSRPKALACTLDALANAGFHLAVCPYGAWVDLLHRTDSAPNSRIEFDQYLLISAWRPDSPDGPDGPEVSGRNFVGLPATSGDEK